MLRSTNKLHGCAIHATDGDLGKVDEFFFDVLNWTIRYLVVDTGTWLTGRRVLLSPAVLGQPDWDRRILPVSLTKKQVELSPDIDTDQPNSFLQEALHASECPVMIVPEDFVPFQHLMIAYDGSKESMYAMKEFCHVLPQYTDLPTEFVYIKEENSQEIPDIDNLKSYSRLHFTSMNFSKLHFKAANYFTNWIGEKQHVLMVCGSFGRSSFSYVTRRSFAERIIHDHKMPVFIAHR